MPPPCPSRPSRPCRTRQACARAAAALLCTGLHLAARADPGYYVVQAYDQAGAVTVEGRFWETTFKRRRALGWPELGMSLGVNSRWTTGVFWSWIGPHRGPFKLNSFNWTNDVLLTQGNWPLDVALHTQWVHDSHDHGGGTLEFGPVLQTDVGRTQANLNLFFDRGLGNDAAQPTTMKLQWQLRHRWQQGLHLGVQGFSELGPWDDWAGHTRQSHRAGPAVFGQLHLGTEGHVALSAAWLQGRSFGRSGHMLSLRAALSY